MIGNKKLVKGRLSQPRRETLPFLTPPPQHLKTSGEQGGSGHSTPVWSTEGSGQNWVVHIPHGWLQVGGLPPNSPRLQPEAPSSPLPGPTWPLLCPFTGETTVVKWCLSPAPGGSALPQPCSGLRRGRSRGSWPREYIHVARQGAGPLSFTPRPAPRMAAAGDALHQGQSGSSAGLTTAR